MLSSSGLSLKLLLIVNPLGEGAVPRRVRTPTEADAHPLKRGSQAHRVTCRPWLNYVGLRT